MKILDICPYCKEPVVFGEGETLIISLDPTRYGHKDCEESRAIADERKLNTIQETAWADDGGPCR